MKKPLISIVLPVLNGEKYLSLAVNSVIAQTYKNWELIIVDNGSFDNTPHIIAEYIKKDPRIKGINCNKKGIVPALNTGLSHCSGPLIARIDADDIWLPEKLEIQEKAVNNDSSLALLGTSVEIINDKGKILADRKAFNNGKPLGYKAVKQLLGRKNLFCHSSILIRKEVIDTLGGYSDRFLHSEDYHLWLKVTNQFKVEILKQKLVKFRYHQNSISRKYARDQQKNSLKLRIALCFSLGNPVANCWFILYDSIKFHSSLLKLRVKRINKRYKTFIKNA